MEGNIKHLKHAVINQIGTDMLAQDYTAIDELFMKLFKHECNVEIAKSFLSNRALDDFEKGKTHLAYEDKD